jgi:23S rRNA (cytosine1962-C5)-methyltransferase
MPGPRVVAVPSSTAAFVANGGRDADFHRAHELGLQPGEQIRLADDRGADVGIAVADPENQKLRVFAVAADNFPAVDGALFGWRVERALRHRTRLGLVGPDCAYRLVHGAGDGLPGFTCDVLGRVAVIYAYAEGLRALGKTLAETIVGFAKLDGAVVKSRVRGAAAAASGGNIEQDVVGKVPESLIATEHDVPYEMHPLGGLNVGLFTDMREHRRGLARFAKDMRVLNLFSYTASLGVACARAGAASVINVDTSEGVQAWARGNFERSGFKPGKQWRFEASEAGRFLTRAIKDKEQYDLVLIDPPGASSGGGASWAIGRDYPDLIAKAGAVIAPDGLLWLASNASELGALAKVAQKGLRTGNRTGVVLELGGLPPEYPTPAVQANDRYLQVCLLRIS